MVHEAHKNWNPFKWKSMQGIIMEGILAACLLSNCLATDPSYDHQNQTYAATYAPAKFTGSHTIAPFFAPEHAADTLTNLIEEADESVDISTPSASSWTSSCSGYADDDSVVESCTPGCTPAEQKNETFPIFPALINALHRGVKIRILTNDYGSPDCPGTITMLQYLALNGADIRYFTTVTFVHSKYISIDNGKSISVSSINWSRTSMTKNREAGALISEAPALADYMQTVFDADFAQAYALIPSDDWPDKDLAIITDSADLDIVMPSIPTESDDPNLFVSPDVSLSSVTTSVNTTTTVQASPDSAWESIKSDFEAVTSSLQVAMYQITTPEICDELVSLFQKGINISLLVSSRVYDESDCKDAQTCYATLYSHGIQIRKTSTDYSYSHNKYWIRDGVSVAWSTGNWSPSDYPTNHTNNYPVYGEPDWWKANRDFTVYTDSSDVVKQFNTVFNQDWYAPYTYPWQPTYDIYCGY